MSLTLAQFRTRVLELLDDSTSTRYTSAQIDTALRQALQEYSQLRPLARTYQFDTTGDQIIALPADFQALLITQVQLYNPDAAADIQIPFRPKRIDEQWVIETIDLIYGADQTLTISYLTNHTIDSLDSASGTTIDDDSLLCTGAAGYAAQARAVSRAEAINMQPAVQTQLLTMATYYLAQFRSGLRMHQFTASISAFTMPTPGE